MTWRELADIFGNEAQKISLGVSGEVSKLVSLCGSELLGRQARSKKEVDAAIVHYCQKHDWPELIDEHRAMLARRLLFAENIVRGFALLRNKRGERLFPSKPTLGEGDLIECLLIDAWERYGLLELQSITTTSIIVGFGNTNPMSTDANPQPRSVIRLKKKQASSGGLSRGNEAQG